MVIPITETLDSIQESPYVHLKHADILYFLTLKKNLYDKIILFT